MNENETSVTGPVLLISGPTAVGKSELSIELAGALGGEVVNIDSVQLYQQLVIGSAKITTEEMRGVPHHLFNLLEPHQRSNVAQYVGEATQCMRDIEGRGNMPVLVGGTTMYVTSLFCGMAPLPERNEELRGELEENSSTELHDRLHELDPVSAARLHPNDRMRVIRALEITLQSGVPMSELIERGQKAEQDFLGLFLVLLRPRDDLYDRINRRSEKMLHEGLLEETLRVRSTYGDVAAFTSLGYAQAIDCLDGRLLEADLSAEIAKYTRRFAKRQMTFWRNEPRKRGWYVFPTPENADGNIGDESDGQYARNTLLGFPVMRLKKEELAAKVQRRFREPFLRNEVWYIDASPLDAEEVGEIG